MNTNNNNNINFWDLLWLCQSVGLHFVLFYTTISTIVTVFVTSFC